MPEETVLALAAPPRSRDNPLTRSTAGLIGLIFLVVMTLACFGSLPYATGEAPDSGSPRYNAGEPKEGRLPPSWAPTDHDQALALNSLVSDEAAGEIATGAGISVDEARATTDGDVGRAMRRHWDRAFLGTDELGRSLLVRSLLGGAISLGIGIAAAGISVFIGTVYGLIAGYVGGKTDAFMMRIVDVIYGLPYILLVVLLAVAGDALTTEWISRSGARASFIENRSREVLVERADDLAGAGTPDELFAQFPDMREELEAEAAAAIPPRDISPSQRNWIDLGILLVAIGGVSWLTMARVIRGQVLSLKSQPFMEAARAIGVPLHRQFLRHLLPNLLGPVIVYATLTVPQAILQESFLSFLGIGVKPPLPSWGNLAADGLDQVNRHRSDWWLLLFPSLLLGVTLLALNFVGEGLREAFDPKRERQG